jgi:hypothetical protein
MSFGSYSTTPASNTSISGINIDENCPSANINNALRQLAADGRSLYDTVTGINLSNYVTVSGGTVGPLIYTASGAYRFNAQSSLTNGATYYLPVGSARPAPGEGVVVFYY